MQEAFEKWAYRRMLRTSWMDKVTNQVFQPINRERGFERHKNKIIGVRCPSDEKSEPGTPTYVGVKYKERLVQDGIEQPVSTTSSNSLE